MNAKRGKHSGKPAPLHNVTDLSERFRSLPSDSAAQQAEAQKHQKAVSDWQRRG